MNQIHVFNHRAMATHFQVRIAGEEKNYAASTAQEAFGLLDKMEARLSRFRVTSEISQIKELKPGEMLRLNASVFRCLQIAQKMEQATRGAFSITAAALQTQKEPPQWTLLPESLSIRCDAGKLEFDLGAVGKGFALDQMAELLREWSCPVFLLVAGGSSILAGDALPETAGWSCGLGEDDSPHRYFLKNCSLSGSGLAVKGKHIFDPRTGAPAQRENRIWALADTAAESDALSTAAMVLEEKEIIEILAPEKSWLVFLPENEYARSLGSRALPPQAWSAYPN
ncbi:MAG TPA: FAD:protein FMN transferase [Verrucomicrobiae bacterium]|nr:FAD:protein FMN transferase [Verrucomicrobiae bacterium]